MKKPILTKYCSLEESAPSASAFERKFEAYIERKVKKIMQNPEKYPFIQLITGDEEDEANGF